MAVTLSASYQKRLGLPGYSSHSFQVSVETEVTDLGQVQGEVARLYGLLQDGVDREIRQIGFVPGSDYGTPAPNGNGNGSHNGNGAHTARVSWNCSDKQRQLVADLQAELGLSEDDLDARSERLFHKPAHRLDKLGASGLISDLLAEAGTRRQRNGNGSNRNGSPRRSPAGAHRNGGGA